MVMSNSAWRKNNRREVLHTLGRYFAMLLIIALGVGFFAGLKITRQAMVLTADEYIKAGKMYDYRLISTFGLTEEDAAEIAALDGIIAAEGAISADFIADYGEFQDLILRAHSITRDIDHLDVVAGQLPEADDEIVVDAMYFTEASIGSTLSVSQKNDRDTLDRFMYQEYTIVGVVKSVNYVYRTDRGTTKLGRGTVDAYAYMPKGGLVQDYYSEIYVTIDSEGEIYSESYDKAVSDMKDALSDKLEERAALRYAEIIEEANDELADGEREYREAYEEYLSKRKDAEEELDDALRKLEDAKAEIDDNEKKLLDGEAELEKSEREYQSAWKDYLKALEDFKKQKQEAEQTMQSKQDELDENRASVKSGMAQIEQSGVLVQYNELLQTKQRLEAALSQIKDQTGPEAMLYQQQLEQVVQGIAQIEASGVIAQYAALELAMKQIAEGQEQLDAAKASAQQQFEDAEAELDAAKQQLEDGRKRIDSARAELEEGKSKLEQGKSEYRDGLKEYEKARSEADASFAEAEQELADARAELDEAREDIAGIKKPVTYVLDRSKNIGYASFENDSAIVEGIARIFPIFFFLVAALVCSTTMTRMVDEHRTQIGTLKALGYSNGAIAWKYVSYSGSAALMGCILGYFGGTALFPYAIWNAYAMLYDFAGMHYLFDLNLAIWMLVVSLLCSVGATYAACKTELAQMPATLMRPKAPKAGKRIFLERIRFLWKRLSFLQKVSIRNIVRYKKRLLMMILGIGGCTALLLTGFGVHDSVGNIAEDQFTKILMYDYTISFSEALTEEERNAFLEDTADLLSVCVFVSTDVYDVSDGKGVQKVNVVATNDPEIQQVVGLSHEGKPVEYPQDGYAVINHRLSETTGVKIGDTLTLSQDGAGTYTVVISGTFENYAFNSMYMTDKTYEAAFGKTADYQTAYAKAASEDLYGISAKLINEYGASNVIVTLDTRNQVSNMMQSLNYIIWLVIACAIALAFVVMYNLSNINITERQREIATIKVLGFYPSETYSYVFRENVVITLLSTFVGLPAGVLLHRFVMDQIKVESMAFRVRILPESFLYAFLITFGLTIFINVILMRKIDKIRMAESLKSIE